MRDKIYTQTSLVVVEHSGVRTSITRLKTMNMFSTATEIGGEVEFCTYNKEQLLEIYPTMTKEMIEKL